jgi:hypothetical protein
MSTFYYAFPRHMSDAIAITAPRSFKRWPSKNATSGLNTAESKTRQQEFACDMVS